jgi:hypothetical protein
MALLLRSLQGISKLLYVYGHTNNLHTKTKQDF